MSVLLPAPFSPSRAWISPGSMTRSMWSFATRDPKIFVIPRSSSFTGRPLLEQGTPSNRTSVVSALHDDGGPGGLARATVPSGARGAPDGLSLSSRGVRRLHDEVARDDLLLVLGELVLQLGRHLVLEVVERGQAHALVLERADVRLVGEVAVDRLAHGVEDRRADLLHDRRDDDVAVLRGEEAVGVDPDDLRVAALRGRGGAEADRAGDRHDDVGALVDEALGEVLA